MVMRLKSQDQHDDSKTEKEKEQYTTVTNTSDAAGARKCPISLFADTHSERAAIQSPNCLKESDTAVFRLPSNVEDHSLCGRQK